MASETGGEIPKEAREFKTPEAVREKAKEFTAPILEKTERGIKSLSKNEAAVGLNWDGVEWELALKKPTEAEKREGATKAMHLTHDVLHIRRRERFHFTDAGHFEKTLQESVPEKELVIQSSESKDPEGGLKLLENLEESIKQHVSKLVIEKKLE